MQNSEFIEKSLSLLESIVENRSIEEIICLGIGKVSECVIAKHQLAFISIVKEKFDIHKIKFYDPALSANDKIILESLKHEILSENKEGKYSVAHITTLFYLPHCPKQITNNLLFSNWNIERLKNLVLICNSFKSIIESTPERFLRPNAHYLLEINPFVEELQLDNNYKFNDIFNDFSILTFTSEKLNETPQEFWNNHPEPVYSTEDLEFVKNGSDKDV